MNPATIKRLNYGENDMENNGHGVSAFENEKLIRDLALGVRPKKILDVGAGSGYYGRILANQRIKMDAVEIWPASVEYLKQSGWYNWVAEMDIRDYKYDDGIYDIVIFGDVLEHLSLEDAVAVFEYAQTHSALVVISIPNSNYPQESLYGNDHERHLIEDPVTDLIPLLKGVPDVYCYEATNTYIFTRDI